MQEQNKQRKEEEKQQLKEKALKGMQKEKSESGVEMQTATGEANGDEDDDKEYYRQEVGEEPDKGYFIIIRQY